MCVGLCWAGGVGHRLLKKLLSCRHNPGTTGRDEQHKVHRNRKPSKAPHTPAKAPRRLARCDRGGVWCRTRPAGVQPAEARGVTAGGVCWSVSRLVNRSVSWSYRPRHQQSLRANTPQVIKQQWLQTNSDAARATAHLHSKGWSASPARRQPAAPAVLPGRVRLPRPRLWCPRPPRPGAAAAWPAAPLRAAPCESRSSSACCPGSSAEPAQQRPGRWKYSRTGQDRAAGGSVLRGSAGEDGVSRK